jgi:hypothetical protein
MSVFRWLLHFDVTRGEDSTGIAFKRARVGTTKYKTTLVKTEGIPYNLYKKFPELFNSRGEFEEETKYNFTFVMGHNRSATVGLVNAENAHPFHHGHIVGAHNGTIHTGLHSLPTGADIKGQTDSEKIFYALSKEMSLKDVVGKLRGALALSWYDEKADTYNLFRNKDRTLFYYMLPTNGTLFYASEAWMLKLAMAKAKITMVGEPIALTNDQHITIQLGGKELVLSMETVEPPLVVVPPSSYQQGQGYQNWSGGNYHGSGGERVWSGRNRKPRYFDQQFKNAGGDNVIQLQHVKPETGWLKMELSKPEFDKNTRHGCTVCSNNLFYDDYLKGDVKWLEKDAPFCMNCASTFKEMETKVG